MYGDGDVFPSYRRRSRRGREEIVRTSRRKEIRMGHIGRDAPNRRCDKLSTTAVPERRCRRCVASVYWIQTGESNHRRRVWGWKSLGGSHGFTSEMNTIPISREEIAITHIPGLTMGGGGLKLGLRSIAYPDINYRFPTMGLKQYLFSCGLTAMCVPTISRDQVKMEFRHISAPRF